MKSKMRKKKYTLRKKSRQATKKSKRKKIIEALAKNVNAATLAQEERKILSTKKTRQALGGHLDKDLENGKC